MPRFSLSRSFSSLLLLVVAVSTTPCAVGAIDIKPRSTYPQFFADIPRHHLRFPFVIHLLAPKPKDDPGAPQPFTDAGRLVLSKDCRLEYVPGELNEARLASLAAYVNAVDGVKLTPPGEHEQTVYGNIVEYGLFSLVQDGVVVDAFFVTCGQEPAPGYIPRYDSSADDLSPDGSRQYSFRPLNPLPGMRLMKLDDFSSEGPAWCR